MSEYTAENRAKRDRPGCVTAYAILLWLSAAASVLVLIVLTFMLGARIGILELCLGGSLLVPLGLNVATGIGLWQMRKWGWALVVILQGLALLLGSLSIGLFVLLLLTGQVDVIEPSALCPSLVGVLLDGIIVYWFITNRELFNGRKASQITTGPEGETTTGPADEKSSDWTPLLVVAGGAVAVLVLICIVVIVMLAILGPQIGNVFSQITYELENPATGVILLP